MSPKVDPKHKEERRKQILKASFICFYKRGYHQTTMRDICKEAKLSAGAVYSYFSSKQDIVRALAVWGEKANQQFFEKKAGDTNPLEQLRSILFQYIEVFEKQEALPSLNVDLHLQSAGLQDSEIFAEVQKSIQSRIKSVKKLLQASKKEGLIHKSVDVNQSAQIILSLLIGAVLQRLFNPQMDMKAYGKEIDKWLKKALKP